MLPGKPALALLAALFAACAACIRVPELPDDSDAGTPNSPPCTTVRAILDARCVECHGPTPGTGAPPDIRLDVFANPPGAFGAAAIAPLMVLLVENHVMPPPSRDPMTGAELALLRAWADAGAPYDECESTLPDAGPADTGADAADAEDAVEDTRPAPDVPAPHPTTEDVYAAVFVRSCGGHHLDGTQLPWLGIDDGADALDARLAQPSLQLPRLNLVELGRPELSYLYLKASGRHTEAGGIGERMPPGVVVTDAQLDLLRRWIAGD